MADPITRPPWDFFHDASISSLQSFELSRLNHAANLRRQVAALLDQWIDDNSQALLARWVRERRGMSPKPVHPGSSEAISASDELAFLDPFLDKRTLRQDLPIRPAPPVAVRTRRGTVAKALTANIRSKLRPPA